MSPIEPEKSEQPQQISIRQLGSKYRLVSKLHVPLGDLVTVEGVVVEGKFKGYEGGPNLRPQRIQGTATQEDIQIPITPYFGDWRQDDWSEETSSGLKREKLQMGGAFEMEGYATGGYVGIPSKAYKRAGMELQTTGHYFREEFVVVNWRQIKPLAFGPTDFVGQEALLQGIARSQGDRALMLGNGWEVIVDPERPWPKDIEGKQIETLGTYEHVAQQTRFALSAGVWRLVTLGDQLGREVELRGRARSLNQIWWFHYRGVDLYVENMQDLPGWSPDCHWRAMMIRGALDKADLPRLDQIAIKRDRDLQEYYIIRNPSWEPLERLLGPERPFDEPE